MLPDTATTGDCLLVHGHSVVQRAIQEATRSPFCHVALLVRTAVGLLVAETVEGVGFQTMTLDDWLAGRPGEDVFYGKAPAVVRDNPAITTRLQRYTDPAARKYDYGALATVWLSWITGRTFPEDGEVCSLFVADMWAACGYVIPGNAAPGSFLYFCESLSHISK